MEISNRKLFSRGMIAIGFAVAVSGIPGELFAADQPETAAVSATAPVQDNESEQADALPPADDGGTGASRPELSSQEEELRRQKFADQDRRIEDARRLFAEDLKEEELLRQKSEEQDASNQEAALESEGEASPEQEEQEPALKDETNKFEKARQIFLAVIGELSDPPRKYGTLWKERRQLFQRELESYKLAKGRELFKQAKVAAAEKRYPNAIQLASEANELSKPEKAADGSQADSPLQADVEDFIDYCQTRQQAAEIRNETDIKTSYPQHEENLAKIKQLLQEARVFYKEGRYEDAIGKVEEVYLIDPFQRDAIQLLNDIYKRIYTAGLKRRNADVEGIFASSMWQWVEPLFPVSIQSNVPSAERKESAVHGMLSKMERIVFPRIEFDNMSVKSVLSYLNDRSKLYDPDKEGVNVTAGFDAATMEKLGKVTMSLSRIPMSEVIRYVCQETGLKYRVEPSGVIVGPNVDEMQLQYFQVRGDLISSITGDASEDSQTGDAAMDESQQFSPDQTQTGVDDGSEGTEGEVSKNYLNRGETRKLSVTAKALMRYFEDRGVPFGEGSSISYDRRSGKLTVRNTVENLRRFDELLRQLDGIQTPLVMVEIKTIEISETDMQELGFDWSMDNLTKNMEAVKDPTTQLPTGEYSLSESEKSGWSFQQGGTRQPNLRGGVNGVSDINSAVVNNLNIFPAIFGRQSIFGSDVPFNLYLTVNALSQNQRTETLAAPKVVTTSGNKASVHMGKTYWFPTDWETYELDADDGDLSIDIPTPDFEEHDDIGINFDVTPVVNPDNYTITLDVNPVIKNFIGKDEYPIFVEGMWIHQAEGNNGFLPSVTTDNVQMRFNVWMPIISVRQLHVNVTVYDGETIVLGGMIDSKNIGRTDKWPILGDLPFVGRFFSSQAENVVRTNLLLFVTTRLVNNDGIPIRRNQRNGAPDFQR